MPEPAAPDHSTAAPAALRDLAPYARLHTFVLLRDLIRKWWRLELFLATATGEPVCPDAGQEAGPQRPYTTANDFCRLALHTPAGARRCADSMRVTVDKLHGAGRGRRFLTHECHLGFDVLACSLWLDGALAGFVGVSGVVHGALSPFAETQLLRKLREVVPAAGNGTDLERALRRVPLLSQAEMEQVADLLALCADEIAAHYEDSRRGHDARREPAQKEAPGQPAHVQELLARLERLEHQVSDLQAGRTQR